MSLKELDVDDVDEPTYITIKRSTFFGLVFTIVILFLLMGSGAMIGYSIATSPKAMCNFVVKHNVGDQDAIDGCYYKLAKEYGDIDYCNSIKNNDLQKECVRVTEIKQAY